MVKPNFFWREINKSSLLKIPENFRDQFYSEIDKVDLKAARFVGIGTPLLVLFFALTGIDYIFAGDKYYYFISLRLINAFICFFCFFLTYQKKFKVNYKLLSCICLTTCGWMIDLMMRELGYGSTYYAGLNIVYLGTFLASWNVKWTLITCLSVYLGYLIPILMFDFHNLDFPIFINNNQFQIFTIATCILITYFQDKIRRTEILNRLTIQKQAEEIRESEEKKQKFIANITHDLKTPLSVISGHAEMLRGRYNEETSEHKFTTFIIESVNQVNRLLDTLISISLLDSKEYKPVLIKHEYCTFVKLFCEKFQVQAKKKNVNFNTDICDGNIIVHVDMGWMERILGNLLQNALKFTDANGSISVKVFREGSWVFTEVQDTGCGIPEDKLNRVFERKYQAHEDKKSQGFGLGLSIVKEMITMLGGSVYVESVNREGSKFWYKIPISLDQTIEVEKPVTYTGPERRKGGDRRIDSRVKAMIESIDQPTPVAQYRGDLSNFENRKPTAPTILICEDTPGQLHLLIEALNDHYNLLLAKNGIEGLAKVEQYGLKIDIILSDVKMPDMDGIEFCQKVCSQEIYQHIPFILITAYYNETEQLQGIKNGATDYLQKPFNDRILKEKLNHWISRREHERVLNELVLSLEKRTEEIMKLRSIIEHEVRNPLQVLTSICFFIERLKESLYHLTNPELQKFWDKTLQIYTVVDTITNTMKAAEVLQKEAASLQKAEEPLITLLDTALAQTTELVGSCKLTIDNPFKRNEAVLCDKRMITQVLVNIIRNATEAISEKGNSGNGEIHIKVCKRDESKYSIDIIDNGIGISQENQEKLFQYRHTTKKDGTGIGLYYSRRILQLHGGEIHVDSKYKEGTTFSVVLPNANTKIQDEKVNDTN